MDLAIETADVGLVVTTAGGCVWRFFAKRDGAAIPIFRAPPDGDAREPLASACFPLVPFGNRVRGNGFMVDGQAVHLTPNTPWDPFYMHGDGWTSEWIVAGRTSHRIKLRLEHRGEGTPYTYEAEQEFALDRATLKVSLAVTNRGETALPFGLGLHPYLPLTPMTTLTARMATYWDQDADLLPTARHPVGGDLDFRTGAPLPRRWVNTGFEGWHGRATVRWPEHGCELVIEADALFDHCVLFVSDPAYDPRYAYESFCFEPMSHGIDDHNKPGHGGLQRLEPGQSLSGSVRFKVGDIRPRDNTTTAETTAASN